MLKVTAHTRVKPVAPPCADCARAFTNRHGMRRCRAHQRQHDGRCEGCSQPIVPGERYRLRFCNEDWYDGPPVSMAHEDCCWLSSNWAFTETVDARAARRARDKASLDYVAHHYGLVLRVGQAVTCKAGDELALRGRVVAGSNHVHVKHRGDRRVHRYHPNDIEPIPAVSAP